MQKLIEGLLRFQTEVFNSQRELFARLSRGQSPEALFITCSDSRINPALLTQTQPGELFILRNAGNIVPPYSNGLRGEDATIEFAVVGLAVQHIVVCGHSLCGAMKALMCPEVLDDLPAMREWLRHTNPGRRPRRAQARQRDDARLAALVQENVLVQLENLRTHPAVEARLARRELTLHAWVYELETGQVLGYDPGQERFRSLTYERLRLECT